MPKNQEFKSKDVFLVKQTNQLTIKNMKHTLVHKTSYIKNVISQNHGPPPLNFFKHKKILPSFPQLMKEKIVRNLDKTIQGKNFLQNLCAVATFASNANFILGFLL